MKNPDYTAMDGAQMLNALGADAQKWAAAFMQFMAKRNGDFTEHDMLGWFANAMQAALTAKLSDVLKDPPYMTGSEAVFGFAAWLTTRDQDITMGRTHECSEVARLCDVFITKNNLPPPRHHWTDNLTHPPEWEPAIPIRVTHPQDFVKPAELAPVKGLISRTTVK